MSTQIELTPVKGMPEELASKGWGLFLTDNMRFRARNEERDLDAGPCPTADAVIAEVRDRQVEFDEADAIREEAAEKEEQPAVSSQQSADEEETGGHDWEKSCLVTQPGGFDTYRCKKCSATAKRYGVSWPPRLDKKQPAECPIWVASKEQLADATVTAEADVIIEEAKQSPGMARTEALELPLDEPPPRMNFEPYTTILAVHTIDPEVALSMRAEGLDMLKVAEYAEALLSGSQPPPGHVFFDGKVYHLAAGAHRHAATIKANMTEFLTTVHAGTKRDALIWAAGENKVHGLSRTNADKRLAVEACLRDEEWVMEADSVIAAHTGTSQPFVGSVRETLESQNIISPQPKRRGKDRIVRDTSNIGAREEAETSDDDRQTALADIGVEMPEREQGQDAETQEAVPVAERVCRVCFCTEDNACEGGCTWVENDLCSQCQFPEAVAAASSSEADEIARALERHGGVLMRMQLEEMGFKYGDVLDAVTAGAILQPETGKFTLPDHKPQPAAGQETGDRRQEAEAGSRQLASSPAPSRPKQKIEELLNGRMLTVSFTWIPKVPGVSVSVKAGKPEDAERGMITADDVPRLPEAVLTMIARQLKGEKPVANKTGAVARPSGRAPSRAKRSKVVIKKKAAPKKAAKKAAKKKSAKGRKR